GVGEEREVLGQHVAGLEVWNNQDLGLACDGRLDALDPCRFGTDRVVEGERPIQLSAGDLAALRHLAKRGRIDRRWYARVYGLDGRQDGHFWRSEPEPGVKIDGILSNVALGLEVGRDVYRGVGDEQGVRMGRHVYHEDVADPAARAQ